MTSSAAMSSNEHHRPELSDLERKLKEGRELMLEVNREKGSSANISVLSTPGGGVENQAEAVSAKSSYSDGDEVLDDAEVASKSNLELLEETERLLNRMSEMNFSKKNSDNGENNDVELNAMLDKAGQLSSMMQSISENLSLNCGETPSLVRQSDQVLKEAGYDDEKMTSTSQYRKDPPGSVPNYNNSKTNSNSPNKEDRPASSVNVMQSMMDDDVSSVGSASLRFTNYNSNPTKTPRQLASSFAAEAEATEEDLFGESFTPTTEKWGNSKSDYIEKDDEDAKEEQLPQAPPSPTGNFSFSSSPRDATMNTGTEGDKGVQWEKVSTAKEGEEDYVPLVDYSHIKVSNQNMPPTRKTPGSRLEQLRKRNAARRRKRMRAMVAFSLMAVVGFCYFKYFPSSTGGIEEPIVEEEIELAPLDTFRTYDTAYILGAEDGFCFEADLGNESLFVTFPTPVAVVAEEEEPVVEKLEEEKPRRGLFGRRKQGMK